MIKAVLFDLDNTLIDFMKMKTFAVDAALDAMIGAGLRLTKEEAHKQLYELYWKKGIEYQKIFQDFLKKVHNEVDYRIVAAGVVAYRQSKIIRPYPGVVPTLLKLKQQGLKLAIVSDAPIMQAWTRLAELKIQDYFDIVVTLDDTGEEKPSAKPFKKALDHLGMKPEEVLHVGDMPEKDIKGAKALGMKTALAKYGLTKPVTVKADYELAAIEDVLAIVQAKS